MKLFLTLFLCLFSFTLLASGTYRLPSKISLSIIQERLLKICSKSPEKSFCKKTQEKKLEIKDSEKSKNSKDK